MNKLTTLEQAVSLIGDGACVGLGGQYLKPRAHGGRL